MKNKRQKLLLIGLIILLFVVLPVAVYLARTSQLLVRHAAFGEVTLNLVPIEVTKNIGEPFLVEVHASSADKPVSAITVSIQGNPESYIIQSVTGAIQTGEAFTDMLYDKNVDPNSFTLLAKKSTANLPKGSFKVATLSVVSVSGGTGTISINPQKSQAVGYNGQSDDVSLTVTSGTQVTYTTTGSLCKITQCIDKASITFTPNLRPDNTTYNVALSFPKGSDQATVYKIFSSKDTEVPASHPETNVVGYVTSVDGQQTFIDTNKGSGYAGASNLHYDIDAYSFCNASPSATPTTGTVSPTPTTVASAVTITYPPSQSSGNPTIATTLTPTITWSHNATISGKTVQEYFFRVDDLANGWTGICTTVNPGDVCLDSVTTTSHLLQGENNHVYAVWIQARYTDGTMSTMAPITYLKIQTGI